MKSLFFKYIKIVNGEAKLAIDKDGDKSNDSIDKKVRFLRDYILSKQYAPNKFKICSHYVGQDDRRFTKVGYFGMIWFMIGNFFNRHNLAHFKKANVEYWK